VLVFVTGNRERRIWEQGTPDLGTPDLGTPDLGTPDLGTESYDPSYKV